MIQLIVTAIVTVALTLIRGAISLIGFLLKWISRILRLLWSLLPVTGSALLLVSGHLAVFAFTGRDLLPPVFPYHPDGMPFLTSLGSLIFLVRDLKDAVPGILGILILVAAVILCVPVLLVLLLAHAGIALLPVLAFLFGAELAVYLIYGLLSRRSPFEQIRGRYYLLFPRMADRHYEKTYHAWLRRHADEFEDDTYGRDREGRRVRRPEDEEEFPRRAPDLYEDEEEVDERTALKSERRARRRSEREDRNRRRIEEYYEEYDENDDDDGYRDDDGYEEEYEEEEEEYGRHRRGNSRKERGRSGGRQRRRGGAWDREIVNDWFTDKYDDGDEEDYEEEYEEEPQQEAPRSSFDFFAGCRSQADVEKKYRSLVKIYHPDNQGGDTSAIQEINAQYAEAKRRFR